MPRSGSWSPAGSPRRGRSSGSRTPGRIRGESPAQAAVEHESHLEECCRFRSGAAGTTNAVTPAAPPVADTTAPTLKLSKLKAKLERKAFLKGFKLTVTP